MKDSRAIQLLRDHGADVSIGLMALGPVIGWQHCIIGAGLVAGASVATRVRRGSFMIVTLPQTR